MTEKLQNFTIVHELSDEHIRQLVAYANEDPDVLKFTRDARRFAEFQSAKNFLGQVDVYALLHDNQLAGIIWFTAKPLPDKAYREQVPSNAYDITFAVRLYERAKGRKLALPFMEEVFSRFEAEKTQNHGIWLETRYDNSRAIHLYKKFGFRQISQPDNDNRIVMVR